jgi:hypothetical protein
MQADASAFAGATTLGSLPRAIASGAINPNVVGAGVPPRRLPMDHVSRMARRREQGYSDERFWRGERSGTLPNRYPEGAFFSRDRETAAGVARLGGFDEPRESALNLTRTFADYKPLTAAEYARLVRAASKDDPMLAAGLVDMVARGKDVRWFAGFARQNPNVVVARPGAHARLMIEANAGNPVDLFKRAGYDALDFGRDVHKLTPKGIRLAGAGFDPKKVNWGNINAGLAAGISSYPLWSPGSPGGE